MLCQCALQGFQRVSQPRVCLLLEKVASLIATTDAFACSRHDVTVWEHWVLCTRHLSPPLLGPLTMDRDPLHDSVLDAAAADAEASDASSATPMTRAERCGWHPTAYRPRTSRTADPHAGAALYGVRSSGTTSIQPGGCHADDSSLAEVLQTHHQCGHECQYWELSASADCSHGASYRVAA